MKKIISKVLAVVVVLSMSIQVLAAPSVTGTVDPTQTSSDKGTVTWEDPEKEKYPEREQDILDKVNGLDEKESLKDAVDGSIDTSGMKVYDPDGNHVSDAGDLPEKLYFLSDLKELKFDGVTPSPDNPVKVTFTVNNMTPDMKLYAWYYLPIEDEWVLSEAVVISENQVTVTFYSEASLMALVYMEEGVPVDSSAGTAPKTGDNNWTTVWAIAAVLLVGFGIFALKKSRKTV